MLPRQEDREATADGFANKLGFLLETQRITVAKLAEALEVNSNVLQDVVDGKAMPTDSLIEKITAHFKIHDTFFTGEKHIDPDSAETVVMTPRHTKSAAPEPASKPKQNWGLLSTPLHGFSPEDSHHSGNLTLKALASRYQALVELLVLKGVISADEYQKSVHRVEERNLTHALHKGNSH